MHEGGYFTYIMASRSRTLYIGVTGNLHKRVFEHKMEGTRWFNCALQLRPPRLVRELPVHSEGDCAGKGAEGLETRKEDCPD
jgi:predicted GIY-YIG superfamily endonuclease